MAFLLELSHVKMYCSIWRENSEIIEKERLKMSEKKQRELRVRCLVLDHDDTVVKSTPEINFPAFLRSLKDLRGTTMSYEQFVEYNFDPGF